MGFISLHSYARGNRLRHARGCAEAHARARAHVCSAQCTLGFDVSEHPSAPEACVRARRHVRGRIARGVCTSQHVHRAHNVHSMMVVDLHIDPTLGLLAVRSQHSQQRVTCTSCQARDHHGSMWAMSKATGKLRSQPHTHGNAFNERDEGSGTYEHTCDTKHTVVPMMMHTRSRARTLVDERLDVLRDCMRLDEDKG
jgi:hypothetical protein